MGYVLYIMSDDNVRFFYAIHEKLIAQCLFANNGEQENNSKICSVIWIYL